MGRKKILNWILLETETQLAGSCEHGSKISCSIRRGEFYYLSDYQFLKKNSDP